jgi:hypothetical protein
VDVQIAPDCERNLCGTACFVTTPDNANIVQDLAKLKACNAETCWACLAMDTCVGPTFDRGRDCWLKSVLADTYKRPGNRHTDPMQDAFWVCLPRGQSGRQRRWKLQRRMTSGDPVFALTHAGKARILWLPLTRLGARVTTRRIVYWGAGPRKSV